jgi:K+-sensing histidine kinase KdpD
VPTPTAPAFTRPALAPGLLAAIALLAGTALLDSDVFTVFRYVVSIFALIVLVFAYRGKAWWALPLLAAVAVLWNPVFVVPVQAELWQGLQFVAAALMIAVGVLVKVPTEGSTASRSVAARGRR